MKKAPTIGTIFELAISLEQAAECFYSGLAVRFAHEPQVATFWKKYADEEAGHARWLEKLRTGLDAIQLRQILDGKDEVIDGAYQLLMTSPEELLQGITNLEEAYQTALMLENSETNTIFEFLITDFSVTSQSREFLREQIHNHADKITRHFPEGFRDTSSRRVVRVAPLATEQSGQKEKKGSQGSA